jgi:hypothetical protein
VQAFPEDFIDREDGHLDASEWLVGEYEATISLTILGTLPAHRSLWQSQHGFHAPSTTCWFTLTEDLPQIAQFPAPKSV